MAISNVTYIHDPASGEIVGAEDTEAQMSIAFQSDEERDCFLLLQGDVSLLERGRSGAAGPIRDGKGAPAATKQITDFLGDKNDAHSAYLKTQMAAAKLPFGELAKELKQLSPLQQARVFLAISPDTALLKKLSATFPEAKKIIDSTYLVDTGTEETTGLKEQLPDNSIGAFYLLGKLEPRYIGPSKGNPLGLDPPQYYDPFCKGLSYDSDAEGHTYCVSNYESDPLSPHLMIHVDGEGAQEKASAEEPTEASTPPSVPGGFEPSNPQGEDDGFDVIADTLSKLDGDVHIEDTEDGGKEITITLPIGENPSDYAEKIMTNIAGLDSDEEDAPLQFEGSYVDEDGAIKIVFLWTKQGQ